MCARLRAAGFGVLSVLHQDTIVEGRVVLTVFDSASFLDILDGSYPNLHARARGLCLTSRLRCPDLLAGVEHACRPVDDPCTRAIDHHA